MAESNTQINVEYEMEMEVLRCMCGDPDNVHPDEPCPKGKVIKLGTVDEWEANPLLRLRFNAGQKLRQLRRKF